MDYLVGNYTCMEDWLCTLFILSCQNDRHYQKLGCFSYGESRNLSPDKLLERVIYWTRESCKTQYRSSRGRVVKAMDLKSIGVSPRRFESCRLRRAVLSFFWLWLDLLATSKFDLSQLIPLNLQCKFKSLKYGTAPHLVTYEMIFKNLALKEIKMKSEYLV